MHLSGKVAKAHRRNPRVATGTMTVADLGRGRQGRATSPWVKISHFHVIFGKNWSSSKLTPPPREILDPSLHYLESTKNLMDDKCNVNSEKCTFMNLLICLNNNVAS